MHTSGKKNTNKEAKLKYVQITCVASKRKKSSATAALSAIYRGWLDRVIVSVVSVSASLWRSSLLLQNFYPWQEKRTPPLTPLILLLKNLTSHWSYSWQFIIPEREREREKAGSWGRDKVPVLQVKGLSRASAAFRQLQFIHLLFFYQVLWFRTFNLK